MLLVVAAAERVREELHGLLRRHVRVGTLLRQDNGLRLRRRGLGLAAKLGGALRRAAGLRHGGLEAREADDQHGVARVVRLGRREADVRWGAGAALAVRAARATAPRVG